MSIQYFTKFKKNHLSLLCKNKIKNIGKKESYCPFLLQTRILISVSDN